MVKCWASVIGGCSSEQSGEHYISQSLFSDSVKISGYKWLGGETKTIGSTPKAKILWRKHNSALSVLNAHAGEAFSELRELQRMYSVRLTLGRQRHWSIRGHQIDGLKFERWVAKAVIGLFCVVGKEDRWHRTGTPPIEPPSDIVEAVFGLRAFEKPMGLWFAQGIGKPTQYVDGVSVTPMVDPETNGLSAALLEFSGISFLVWFDTEKLASFTTHDGAYFGPGGEEPLYHPKRMDFRISGSRSHYLKFIW